MAVIPLDPWNTERWYLSYTAQDVAHTAIMRVAAAQLAEDAAIAFHTFLSALAEGLVEIAITGLAKTAVGSNIRVPQSTSGLDLTYGSISPSDANKPLQVTFTGRSLDGRKTRVGMYGYFSMNDASWRKTVAEENEVANTVDALETLSAGGFFVSISGQRVFWHQYMNLGFNDHFVREARQGG